MYVREPPAGAPALRAAGGRGGAAAPGAELAGQKATRLQAHSREREVNPLSSLGGGCQ